MKLMLMIAAWAVSAILVLPTVSQAEGSGIDAQAAAAVVGRVPA